MALDTEIDVEAGKEPKWSSHSLRRLADNTARRFRADTDVPAAEITTAVGALVGFALSHGILMLGSVIHHVPTASPHGELL